MDAATVKELVGLVRAATPAQRIVPTPPGEPAGVYYVEGPTGLTRVMALTPPDNHAADDLPTLAAVAQKWQGSPGDGASLPGPTVAVWYDREHVTAVASLPDLKPDTCTLALEPSPQLAHLAAWREKGKAQVTQRELVLLLRTTFAGCWEDGQPDLLDAVRKLRTSKAAEVNAEVQRGKVSLGRSMTAEMSGVKDIPELVTFQVPVFTGAAVQVRAGVRVALDPDPEREEFQVVVLPEEIDRAFAVGEERVETLLDGLLADTGIPVYHGRP